MERINNRILTECARIVKTYLFAYVLIYSSQQSCDTLFSFHTWLYPGKLSNFPNVIQPISDQDQYITNLQVCTLLFQCIIMHHHWRYKIEANDCFPKTSEGVLGGLEGRQEKEPHTDWVKALELGGTNTWYIASHSMLQTPQIGNYTLFFWTRHFTQNPSQSNVPGNCQQATC